MLFCYQNYNDDKPYNGLAAILPVQVRTWDENTSTQPLLGQY